MIEDLPSASLLKPQLVSYLKTKTPLPDSTPVVCHVVSITPFTVTDGFWSFPAKVSDPLPEGVVEGTVLRVQKFVFEVEKGRCILSIQQYEVEPANPEVKKVSATPYQEDPEISKLLETFAKSKKQSKFRLSLPKSLNSKAATTNSSNNKNAAKKKTEEGSMVFKILRDIVPEKPTAAGDEISHIENSLQATDQTRKEDEVPVFQVEQIAKNNENDSKKEEADLACPQYNGDKATKTPEHDDAKGLEIPMSDISAIIPAEVPLFERIQQAFSSPDKRVFKVSKGKVEKRKPTLAKVEKKPTIEPTKRSPRQEAENKVPRKIKAVKWGNYVVPCSENINVTQNEYLRFIKWREVCGTLTKICAEAKPVEWIRTTENWWRTKFGGCRAVTNAE